jgi:hypothetical protein
MKPQLQATLQTSNENPIVQVGARKCYLTNRLLDLRLDTELHKELLNVA